MFGFTQKEFAKWLNVNELTIRRLESGETPIKNSSTVRILLLNLKLLELNMKIDQEAWKKSYNAQKQENDIPDDFILGLGLPPHLEAFLKSGDPITVGDVYNYCQEQFPSEKRPSEMTKEEFKEVTNKIQKFIWAWYDIEGDRQTRWEYAIRQCEKEV
jgi:DNA-binding XRE family transcriptional regulator